MIVRIDRKIRTVADLEDVLSQSHVPWDNLNKEIQSNVDDNTSYVFKLFSYAIQKGILSTKSIRDILDITECSEEILDAICALYNLPVPNFPTYSKVLTHVDYGTASPGDTINHNHDLHTEDYIVQFSVKIGTTWYVQNIPIECTATYSRMIMPSIPTTIGLYSIKYIYHRDYVYAKRVMARFAKQVTDLQGTIEAIRLYLAYLLCNTMDVTIEYYPRVYPVFRFYSDISNNYINSWVSRSTTDGAPFTLPPIAVNSYIGANASPLGSDYDVIPRYVTELGSDDSFSLLLTINITADFTPRMEDFVRKSILENFIPFIGSSNQNININFTSYTLRW